MSFESHWTKERIKELRLKYGMTQAEMGEKLNIRQQTISEWETGAYKPRRMATYILDTFAKEMEAINSSL